MTIRTPATGFVGGILLGAAVGLAGPATADGEIDVPAGAYEETDLSGTYTWNFTPCGPDCTVVASLDDKSVDGLVFRRDDQTWAASGPVRLRPPACGTEVPATVHYSFHTATLDGEYFSTVNANMCGFSTGFAIPKRSLRLTKVD